MARSPSLPVSFDRMAPPYQAAAGASGWSRFVRLLAKADAGSPARDAGEVLAVTALVTLAGWFTPLSYHALGQVYLLVVVFLSVRVGRGAAVLAAVLSGLAWNYVFIPPRLSFSVVNFDDAMLLGIYFAAALGAGQLAARLRAQQLAEQQRERRASALYRLTRGMAEAAGFDEAVAFALRQTEETFGVRAALWVASSGAPRWHPAGSWAPGGKEAAVAAWATEHRQEAGRFTAHLAEAEGWHLPLLYGGRCLGVLATRWEAPSVPPATAQRELLEMIAAQIALQADREQLRSAEERAKFFAESDRLHRTLLDSVSHELKTPLAVLHAAGARLGGGEPAAEAVLHREIRTATGRLNHLVGNLLNQTRLEAGLSIQADWCDVRDILNGARRYAGNALAPHPLSVAVAEDFPLLWADEVLLEQAVANLLLNASAHTPAGTAVAVSAGTERAAAGREVFIRVEDQGPGLPAEVREALFVKFRRGREARPGGLGLGLSIVRGFVEAHGGRVEADHRPGGGARFTLRLPVAAHGKVPGDDS